MIDNYFWKIGIIGDGKMGVDIFFYLLDFDFFLALVCKEEEKKDEIKKKFDKKIKRLYDSRAITEDDYNKKTKNTIITTKIEYLKDCDLIIEAIFENVEDKKNLFKDIDKSVNKDCIFASNSSSIIPSKICPMGERENKFVGLHFFYPVKMKNFVELIKTTKTSLKTFETIKSFLSRINKKYIYLDETNPFILNKSFLASQAEAFRILEENILSIQEIDALTRERIFPIGIFEFFDNVGIDIMYNAITQYVENDEQIEFYKPMLKKLKELINKNSLGLKNGNGFYSYNLIEPGKEKIKIIDNEYKDDVINRLIFLYINSVYKIIEKKICSKEDIEYFIKEYMDVEKGPIELSKEIGLDKIYQILIENHKKYGFNAYLPSKLLKI